MFKHILPKKILTRNVKILISVYLLLVVVIYVSQRNLMYYPSTLSAHKPQDYGLEMEIVRTRTSDGLILKHWFAPPRNDIYPTIVFFHGNGGHLGSYASILKQILDQGYGLLAVEYRGYGDNKGNITEQNLYSDAHSAMKWLLNRGYTDKNLFLLGYSLGSGIATEMAYVYDVGGLVLVSSFASAVDLGQSIYWYLPVSLLIKDRYANIVKIGEIKDPLLIVHGKNDETVPIASSRRLFKAAREPKKMVEIEGAGHNNIFSTGGFEPIHEFIQSIY